MVGSLAFAQEDAKGCKDHPLFTRMPNFYINKCETKEYDEVDFYEPPKGEKRVKVGGKKYVIEYLAKKGFEGKDVFSSDYAQLCKCRQTDWRNRI